MARRYYWNIAGMTVDDLEGYFRLVEFDELGFSTEWMTESELENEMQCFAAECGWSEGETREFFADRVADNMTRDRAWERYLQTGER